MARNGSGTYTLPAGNPVVTGTTISSTWANNTLSDIGTALTQSLAYDGQTTPVANLPMGGFKHTGTAVAASLTDYCRADQAQNSAFQLLSGVSGTNTITGSASITPSAYAAPQTFRFVAAGTNTGAVTINVSSLGAKSIKKRQSGGKVELVANDIVSGIEYSITYDGTDFLLNEQRPYSHGADIASASTINLDTATGDCVDVTGAATINTITLAEGEERTVRFTGTPTITNGANLILLGGGNITAIAGSFATFRGYASDVVRMTYYSGMLASGGFSNDFRLTLTSGVPFTTSNVTSASTIYLTPCTGNNISLYSGGVWSTVASAEVSLTLSSLSTTKPYDIFAYNNSSAVSLESLAWTNDTTRATALAYQNGVLVKSGDSTKRYLGTFYPTSATTTEDSSTNRYLWNLYHQVEKTGFITDNSAGWTYTTATWRAANGNTANRFGFVIGVSMNAVSGNCFSRVNNSSANVAVRSGIGLDSTSSPSSDCIVEAWYTPAAGVNISASATLKTIPSAGLHLCYMLEYSGATGTSSWYMGTSDGGAQAGGLLMSIYC